MVLSTSVIGSFDLDAKLSNIQIDSMESAERALMLAGELSVAADERRRIFAQSWNRDDLLGQTLRAMSDQMPYFQTDALTGRENLFISAAIEALQWLNAHEEPAAFEDRMDRLCLAAEDMPFAKALAAWSMVSDQRSENLLEMQPKENDGTLKIIPTRTYLVGAKVRTAATTETPEKPVKLRVRCRDSAGQWLESSVVSRAISPGAKADSWIWTVVPAPRNASKLVIIPEGRQTPEQAAGYFSDLTVYWLE
jgi:hypothetical protein